MNNRIDTVARARQLAAEHNIPLSRLTKECGINHSTLSAARVRGCQLQVDTIARICDYIGITIREFFTVEEGTAVREEIVEAPVKVHHVTFSA